MPEIPDIEAYITALNGRVIGERLCGVRIVSPFLVRTVSPSPSAAVGLRVKHIERLGKRVVFEFDDETSDAGALFMVIHLMIAGRLHWKPPRSADRKSTRLNSSHRYLS